MSLTFGELEAVTTDYFAAENGKAVDIYFYTSFLMEYLMKQKKGLYMTPDGGDYIRVPLEYDGQEGGFYARGDTVSSDDRESVNAARFAWRHAYGNASIYRIDTLKNSGLEQEIDLVEQRLAGAQKTVAKVIAESTFDDAGAGSTRWGGLRACCNETSATAYGDIAEDDLVAADGTKPWEGKTNSTGYVISPNLLRTGRSAAKVRDGKFGKPDLVITTETLWNKWADMLQAQQRFTDGKETVKAGFTGFYFDGMEVYPDDYCPSGYAFWVNSKHYGYAVHKRGNFVREKWMKIPDSPGDKSMKIYVDGNTICNNRKAQQAYSGLS